MEHVRCEDAVRHTHSENCTVHEYTTKNLEMNIAVAEISYRYPATGYALNHKCNEMGYVLKGSGKLVTKTSEVFVAIGDVVYIPHGEKYYWEGFLTILLPVSPAWYPEQHEVVASSQNQLLNLEA